MAQLTGIAVTLKTAADDFDIDRRLYIGVIGEGGGREFPLNSQYQDFIAGEEEKFVLGSLWEESFIDRETKMSLQSEKGKNNDPAFIPLDLDKVRFVYLRKQDDGSDEAYKLQLLRVVLYGSVSPSMRTFIFDNLDGRNVLWLGNEYGQVVYLQEVSAP